MSERFFTKIIREICDENDIEMEVLSFDLILKLKKNKKIRYIIDNCFGTNTSTSDRIASDKYALYEVLKSENIPIIEHVMLFNPNVRKNIMNEDLFLKILKNFSNKYNDKIVIKANDGREGFNVYYSQNFYESIEIAQNLFKIKSSISICPFYNIKEEYRVVYLNGECEIIYSKQRPYLIGNGINTVSELMIKNKLELSKYITHDKVDGVDLNYIPKLDERILLTWKHNLYNGAVPSILNDDKLKLNIIRLANKIANVIGIDFATIDIIELDNGELMALEVNSGVGMTIFSELAPNGYEITKEIYTKAVKNLFK